MSLNRHRLLSWSNYIQYTLAPKINTPNNFRATPPSFSIARLRSLLDSLYDFRMTPEILEHTRIQNAFIMILENGGIGWPPDIVSKVRELVERWDRIQEDTGLPKTRVVQNQSWKFRLWMHNMHRGQIVSL